MQDFMDSATETHFGIRPVSIALHGPALSALVGSLAPTFLHGSAEAVMTASPRGQWHFGGGCGATRKSPWLPSSGLWPVMVNRGMVRQEVVTISDAAPN